MVTNRLCRLIPLAALAGLYACAEPPTESESSTPTPLLSTAPRSLQDDRGITIPLQPDFVITPNGDVVLDFDGFADLTAITDQFAGLGVTVTGASVLNAGGMLNPNFPPHSGSGVVFDFPLSFGGEMTFTFTRLLGTDASGGSLLLIDPATGASTVIGAMGAGVVPALAVEPQEGIIVYGGRGGGLPNIYKVDPASGAASLLGSTGLGFAAVGGMDVRRQDERLFAAVNIAGDGGTGSDHLAVIDKSTGDASIIGPFGTCSGVVIPSTGGGSCTIEGIEGIAFDRRGRLWGAHSERGADGRPGLYRIDTHTGKATFVNPILDANGNPPSGGVVSLAFSQDGRLFGGTARAIFPATDGGRLIRINPATGEFSFVGAVSATGGSSLGGLAFTPTVVRAGAAVTGNQVITMRCFDAAGALLGSSSLPAANFVGAGNHVPPNFPLGVAAHGPRKIASCTFSDGGNSYTVDDFIFTHRSAPVD